MGGGVYVILGELFTKFCSFHDEKITFYLHALKMNFFGAKQMCTFVNSDSWNVIKNLVTLAAAPFIHTEQNFLTVEESLLLCFAHN